MNRVIQKTGLKVFVIATLKEGARSAFICYGTDYKMQSMNTTSVKILQSDHAKEGLDGLRAGVCQVFYLYDWYIQISLKVSFCVAWFKSCCRDVFLLEYIASCVSGANFCSALSPAAFNQFFNMIYKVLDFCDDLTEFCTKFIKSETSLNVFCNIIINFYYFGFA